MIEDKDTEHDNEDGIRCRRCGTDGLYWVKVTLFDGRADKPMLFDSRNKRRHTCGPCDDAFEKVPE